MCHNHAYKILEQTSDIINGILNILDGVYERKYPSPCRNCGITMGENNIVSYEGPNDVWRFLDDLVEESEIMNTHLFPKVMPSLYPNPTSIHLARIIVKRSEDLTPEEILKAYDMLIGHYASIGKLTQEQTEKLMSLHEEYIRSRN